MFEGKRVGSVLCTLTDIGQTVRHGREYVYSQIHYDRKRFMFYRPFERLSEIRGGK